MAKTIKNQPAQTVPQLTPAQMEAIAAIMAGGSVKVGTEKPAPALKEAKKGKIRDIGTYVVQRPDRKGNMVATEYSVAIGKSGNPYLTSDRAYNPAASIFDIMEITAKKAGLEWFVEAMGVLREFYAR